MVSFAEIVINWSVVKILVLTKKIYFTPSVPLKQTSFSTTFTCLLVLQVFYLRYAERRWEML